MRTIYWRIIDTGKNEGHLNMATDEAILNVHAQGLTPPTLRIFQWEPPTLSIGYRQPLEEINLEECEKLKINVVRRPTGAKAVLHQDDLTYSVVISVKEGAPPSVMACYKFLNQGLIAAFSKLGLRTSLTESPERDFTPACFASTGQSDLVCNRRKIAGSVLTGKEGTFLQHGSIAIRQHSDILLKLLRFPSPEIKKAVERRLEHSTSLEEILKGISLREIKKALFDGFETAFGITLMEDSLCKMELLEVERLAEKYKKLDWEGERS